MGGRRVEEAAVALDAKAKFASRPDEFGEAARSARLGSRCSFRAAERILGRRRRRLIPIRPELIGKHVSPASASPGEPSEFLGAFRQGARLKARRYCRQVFDACSHGLT